MEKLLNRSLVTNSKGLYYLLMGIIFVTLISFLPLLGQQPAFPGAEGFGKLVTGGRGGAVLEVSNLNDSGSGSLRDAIEQPLTRTIIFKISGTIFLESPLFINKDNLTIAGQSAAGSGICIAGYPTIISANNVIIRFLRFRLGDINKIAEDAIMAIKQKNIIIDHCSMSWGTDEVASFYDNINLTVQWSIISESLHYSFHPKGEHGYGGIWGGNGASFHHNILAHHASRNPRFNGSRTSGEPENELVDFRNNIIYNWGFNSAYGGESGKYNIIANYYKSGPASKHKDRIVEPWDEKGVWFVSQNYVHGFEAVTKNNWNGGVQGEFINSIKSESPHNVVEIEMDTAMEAYKKVLDSAGAVFPKRDAVDKRIISEIREGKARYGGKYGQKSGIIDTQEQVGSWPILNSAQPEADEDHDGMPDEWEINQNLDVSNPQDGNDDHDHDGYTNLEEYLNSLVENTGLK